MSTRRAHPVRLATATGALALIAAAGVLLPAASAAADPGTTPVPAVTAPVSTPAPIAPVAPVSGPPGTSTVAGSTAAVTAPRVTAPTPPTVSITVPGLGTGGSSAMSGLSTVLLLGAISLVPTLLVMVTAFPRIVVVLGLTRSALGTQSSPPNQVIIGLALFLTCFVMAPTFSAANHDALQPYLKGRISISQAYDRAQGPFRDFMLKQTRQKDLGLFVKIGHEARPTKPADLPITTIVPAFVLSELRAAFLIGFIIYVPFLIIDLVVASVLSGVGMVMLPPGPISLAFKLLLFVMTDGWYLIVESLVHSYR